MLKTMRLALCVLLFQGLAALPVIASEVEYSGKNDIWENPFIAYGFNPKTNVVTGYLAALRISPGRTDECKLVFSGNYAKSNILSIKYLSEARGNSKFRKSNSSATFERGGSEFFLRFRKDSLGGDCEWILPFVGEPRVRETTNEVEVSLGKPNRGEWVGVSVIKSTKAKFYSSPDNSTNAKAFLVEGDIIYVYKEQADWYFVEFDGKKKKTIGWIKKTDTVQL